MCFSFFQNQQSLRSLTEQSGNIIRLPDVFEIRRDFKNTLSNNQATIRSHSRTNHVVGLVIVIIVRSIFHSYVEQHFNPDHFQHALKQTTLVSCTSFEGVSRRRLRRPLLSRLSLDPQYPNCDGVPAPDLLLYRPPKPSMLRDEQ